MKKTKTTSVDLLPLIAKALKPLYAATSVTGLIELFTKKKITGEPGESDDCLFAAYGQQALEGLDLSVSYDGSNFEIDGQRLHLVLHGTDTMEKLAIEFDNYNDSDKKLAKKYAKLRRPANDGDEA